MEKYTREKWEMGGLLEKTPEERKDFVVETLNSTLELMTNIEITMDSNNETLMIPIILRIVNSIDITIEDIKEIYNQISKEFPNFIEKNKELGVLNIDLEAMYCSEFCSEYIKLKKN